MVEDVIRENTLYVREVKFLKNGFNFHLRAFFEVTECKFQVLLELNDKSSSCYLQSQKY